MNTFSLRARVGAVAGAVALAASLQMISAVPAGAASPLQCQISMQLAMKVIPVTHKTEFAELGWMGFFEVVE